MSTPWQPIRRSWAKLWPRTCLACGSDTHAPMDCCFACQRALPKIPSSCARCGLPLVQSALLCNACLMAKPAFDCTHAGFEHSGLIAEWVQRFKKTGDLTVSRLLAQLLSKVLQDSVTRWPQAVVSVPTPMRRRLWRGMNHAEQLALDMARICGAIPYKPWLVTTRTTALQSKQSDAGRWTNVSHAFAVKIPKSEQHSLPQSVALVDDVMVSGATAHHAAKALKQAGIPSVQVWVVARVCPDP